MYTQKTQYQKTAIERAVPIVLSLLLFVTLAYGLIAAAQKFAAVAGGLY